MNAQVNRLVLNIKLTLAKNKYLPNFRTIYRSFVNYDHEQSGLVSPNHFEKVFMNLCRHSTKIVFSLRNFKFRSLRKHLDKMEK